LQGRIQGGQALKNLQGISMFAILFLLPFVPIQQIDAAETTETKIITLLQNGQYAQLDSIMNRLERAYKKDFLKEEEAEKAYYAFARPNPDHEKYYNDWVSKDPGSPFAYLARAEYYDAMGWKSRGGKFTDETSKSQFNKMEYYFKKSIDDIKKAMQLNPEIVHSYITLIQIYKNMDLDAGPIVEKALSINPYSLRVRQVQLMNLLPRWGGSIEAMEAFVAQARPYYKKNPKLRVLEGRILAEKGDQARFYEKNYEKALEYYDAALKHGDYFLTLESKGDIHYRKKNYPAALDAYKRALRSTPFDVDMLVGCARCMYCIGDKQAAYKYAQEVLDIDPDHAEAHNIVGLSYKELGKLKDAEREFRKALELKPTDKAYKRNLDSVLP
jgi:tetratricopeptide (TPR) repeat protein